MSDPTRRMRRAAAVVCLVLGSMTGAAAEDARSKIARGIEALHYFEYEEANEAFREAHRLDAGLVMACWGEAMTYHQTLWRKEDVQAGRTALARCGTTPAPRAAQALSLKEKMFLEAAHPL